MVDTNKLLGQTINDRYRVLEHVGTGGSGNVYKALNVESGSVVALKILRGMETETPEAVIRFEKEIAASARIANPHMVDVYEFGRSKEGYLFIVMEFLSGVTLSSVIEKEAPLPAARSCQLIQQVLAALSDAHAAGVVHRDLKPDNIFLVGGEGEDVVKVLDFGIAKFLQDDTVGTTLSRDGFIFGTPLYISPEQALGWKVGPASDIYSLGVVLFEMLSGFPPFTAETPIGLGMKHVYEPPPLERLRALDEPLAGVKKVLALMLEKRPERRPDSAAAVASLLDGLQIPASSTFDVNANGAQRRKAGSASSDAMTIKTKPQPKIEQPQTAADPPAAAPIPTEVSVDQEDVEKSSDAGAAATESRSKKKRKRKKKAQAAAQAASQGAGQASGQQDAQSGGMQGAESRGRQAASGSGRQAAPDGGQREASTLPRSAPTEPIPVLSSPDVAARPNAAAGDGIAIRPAEHAAADRAVLDDATAGRASDDDARSDESDEKPMETAPQTAFAEVWEEEPAPRAAPPAPRPTPERRKGESRHEERASASAAADSTQSKSVPMSDFALDTDGSRFADIGEEPLWEAPGGSSGARSGGLPWIAWVLLVVGVGLVALVAIALLSGGDVAPHS